MTPHQELVKFLEKHHYFIESKIGEGQTRDVYKAAYRKGPVEELRVIKIPKTDLSKASVTTKINLSKGNPNLREVKILSALAHHSIIKLLQAFSYHGRTITVEEHINGITLEEPIMKHGPLTYSEFREIFTPILQALQYLHLECRLLHNDIKPANILVSPQDYKVKLIDFQNARPMDSTRREYFPTRGATNFTEPRVIKNILLKKRSSMTIANDLYALGVTMFYALEKDTPLYHEAKQKGKRLALFDEGIEKRDIDLQELEEIIAIRTLDKPQILRYSLLSSERERLSENADNAHHLLYYALTGSVFLETEQQLYFPSSSNPISGLEAR